MGTVPEGAVAQRPRLLADLHLLVPEPYAHWLRKTSSKTLHETRSLRSRLDTKLTCCACDFRSASVVETVTRYTTLRLWLAIDFAMSNAQLSLFNWNSRCYETRDREQRNVDDGHDWLGAVVWRALFDDLQSHL